MMDPGLSTALQQVAGAADIVGVVLERIAHRLGNDGEGRKVDHGVHIVFAHQAADQLPIADVTDDQGRIGDRLPKSARQIIEHHHGFAAFAQLQHHVAADIPGSACDQNGSSPHDYPRASTVMSS